MQSSLKAYPEDARYGAFTRGKNTLCKNFVVKEEGCLLKGGVFSGTYGT